MRISKLDQTGLTDAPPCLSPARDHLEDQLPWAQADPPDMPVLFEGAHPYPAN